MTDASLRNSSPALVNSTTVDGANRVVVTNHTTIKGATHRISFSVSKVLFTGNKSSVQEEMGLIVLLMSVLFVVVVVLRWKAIIGQGIVVLVLFYAFFIITIGITEDRWRKLSS